MTTLVFVVSPCASAALADQTVPGAVPLRHLPADGDAAAATRRGLSIGLLIALASLWLRAGFPISAITNAIHDDALFIRAAAALRAGHWLGPYDNLTLLKGMFYPLFIALASLLAVPLNLAEQLAYLGASALVAGFLRRVTGSGALGLACFAALAFNPVVWEPALGQVFRDALYLSQALAVIALAADLAFPPPGRRRVWLTAVALGAMLAAFWLTREEGVWLLPALAVVLAAGLIGGARPLRRRRAAASPLAVTGVTFAALLLTVACINWRTYGVFVDNEVKAAPFRHAFGALARVGQDQWRPLVVFPSDARARAYQVSPAARELAPYLEGAGGAAWHRISCEVSATPGCPEILSGWFWLALRDAVSAAGHGGSARDARAYYLRLASEIDAACDAREIPCGPPRASVQPIFHWSLVPEAARRALILLRHLLTFNGGQVGSPPSIGPRAGYARFVEMAGDVAPYATAGRTVYGWVAAPAGRPELSLRIAPGSRADTMLTPVPADDVEAALPGWHASRFALDAACFEPACDVRLVATVPGQPPLALPLDRLAVGSVIDTPSLRATVDSVVADAPAGSRRAAQLWTARLLARAYALATPVLAASAVLGLLLAGGLSRRMARPPGWLAVLALLAASAVAFAARVVLLGYIDAAAIPVITPRPTLVYAASATPFLIIMVVLGNWLLIRALATARAAGKTGAG